MEEIKLQKRKRKAQNENNKQLLISTCTDLADIYIKRGEHKLAIEEYSILADIYKAQNNKIEYAMINRGLGEAYMGLNNFKTALDYLKIYLDVSVEQKNDLEKQRAYATLGHAYLTWYLETQNDPEKTLNNAFKYFMKSLMIAQSLTGISKFDKADMTARLFANLGVVKECSGEYEKALELMNKSIAVCKQNDIYEQLHRGYYAIASLYEKMQNSNEAIQYYNLAAQAAKNLKTNDLICSALIGKSVLLIKLADFHGAKQVLVKAYKLKTPNIKESKLIERNLRIVAKMCYTEDKLVVSSGDSREMKKLYEIMGDGACELGNYSKAIEYYQLVLKYAEKSGVNNKELATCYYNLAETYKDNTQYKEAVEYYEKEYALGSNLQDSLNTLSVIADATESSKASKDEVKKVYERALKKCRENKNLKEERRMVIRFIDYLRRNNHHSDAFEMENYLSSLENIDPEDESSSEPESEASETKGTVGSELNLDEITDDSDDSDIENKAVEISPDKVPTKRRSKTFSIKKNQKGETQLHTACINGKLPVVKHLLDQGHPVNVRDHTGWLPIHEACNHGYYEIVKLLLDKGAAINDRGGTLCNGVTPLYDAASNGHLRIVELLLDRGASAIIKTDEGDTPLNIIKEWYKKNSLSGEDMRLYQSLVSRMTEIMQRAGQKVLAITTKDLSQREPTEITNRRSHEEPRRNLQKRSPRRDRSIIVDLDDDDVMSADSTSEEFLETNSVEEYQNVMSTLKRKSSYEEYRQNSSRQPVPALINSDDFDDWLEDDLMSSRPVKKQKLTNFEFSSAGTSSAKNTQVSPRQRKSDSPLKKSQTSLRKLSNDFIIPDNFFDEEFEDNNSLIEPIIRPMINEERRHSAESSSSSKSSNTRKTQVSLLETGFSRHNSSTFKSQRSNDNISSGKSPLKRNNSTEILRTKQPKMTNFVRNRSFTEPDSTTQTKQIEIQSTPTPTPTPSVGDLMVFVDVKIEGMVFRIPVLLSQVQTNTLGWLAEQAAHKYARKEGSKPQLDLETTTGALLSDEDPLSLLFPLGAVQAEPVIGKIVKMSLPPLAERYKEACSQMDIDQNVNVCSLLEVMSIELNLNNKCFKSTALLPLCKALNHQTSLFELNLSGNYLDTNCIKKLCISLPTLVNLATLNLSCTGLSAGHLAEIVTVFTSTSNPVLQNLHTLDLSDNFLGDRSLRHLSLITKHLKLTSLNLSNVKFTSNLFFEANNENMELNLRNIQIFDISDNKLERDDITKMLCWIDFTRLRKLNLSKIIRKEGGILENITNFLENSGRQLESLNLSRCMVQETELYEFLRLTAKSSLTNLNLSHNPNLTGISLRRLLECSNLQSVDLTGCDKILHYFGGCGENDYLLQDSDKRQRKLLKISVKVQEYEQELQALINIFKDKYEQYSIEKKNLYQLCLLVISSKPLDRKST